MSSSKELWSWRCLSASGNHLKGEGGEKERVEEREKMAEERGQAVEKREKEVEERILAVEERSRAVVDRELGVEKKEKEVEGRSRAVVDRELGVEKREKEVEEWRRAVVEREMGVEKREKEVVERENEVEERNLWVEKREMEVEEREVKVEDREKELMEANVRRELTKAKILGLREAEIKEEWNRLELKEKEFDERCQVLEAKKSQIVKREGDIELERREIDERCRWLEAKEKRILEREDDIYSKKKNVKSQMRQFKKFRVKEKHRTIEPPVLHWPSAHFRLPEQFRPPTAGIGPSCTYAPGYFGHIQSLIRKDEQLLAVAFICEYKMQDYFPPVPLLKAYLEGIRKRVCEMVEKGSDTAQNDAINMELSSLKAVLKYISMFKLESSFSPAPLELRIKQLEKEMEAH
ncbi:hypothetical protein SOVF_040230 [Spinacia oleracea]|nr:hypothetical protein SOVF_040230 [Spinacia oleracea]